MRVKVSATDPERRRAEEADRSPARTGVQNLRKAVYDFKLRAEAADIGSAKHTKILHVACNYLYRCVLPSAPLLPLPLTLLFFHTATLPSSYSPTTFSRRALPCPKIPTRRRRREEEERRR